MDLWALAEVGGGVRQDDRMAAETRLRRAVIAIRTLRLSGGR